VTFQPMGPYFRLSRITEWKKARAKTSFLYWNDLLNSSSNLA
jgi:hypothetical protein